MKGTKKLFILLSLLIVAAMVLSACGGQPAEEPVVEEPVVEEPVVEEPAEEDTGGIVAEEATPTVVVLETSEYGEAPMLADMVAAGDLPPVEERLPVAEDIMVVAGVDGIGEYGGVWHGYTWWQGYGNIEMMIYDPPVRWNTTYTGYEPGLVKDYQVSEDGKTLTWVFRQGLKWSDGTPFSTIEDMGYWWELATNEDFKVVTIPWWGRDSDGAAMEVTFPNDYTMVMQWGEPHYIATYVVAQGFWEWLPLERPKHFLSPHDPAYNADATYEELEEYVYGGDWLGNVAGYPCLHAWCPESVTPGERTVWNRNPYYWKVDAEGNQLPYIDVVDVRLVSDAEVRLLELSQGKSEASFRGTDNPTNIPFLLEQADQPGCSGVHLYQLLPGCRRRLLNHLRKL
ncbi:MAG: ABC transporter substrate-binding protein, partial [Anaerolineales bacterium]|nr:ABC transporter substrate-binding protein [Anaerolineales bacterium]